MNEFNIEEYNFTFRVKKMNAIQLLALRSQIDFDDYIKTEQFYNLVLNNIEVGFDGQWLPVRSKAPNGEIIYYPNGVDSNVDAVQSLINYFIKDFLKPVFTKSTESK